MPINSELIDIRNPVELPAEWWPFVLALLLLASILPFWLRRRRKNAGVGVMKWEPGKSCWQAALESLAALEAGHWDSEAEQKLFYSHLSHIVRCYIELRFDLPAPERTTEEFLESLRNDTSLPADDRQVLQELLSASDLVKFAGFSSTKKEMAVMVGLARKFIERNIPGELA